MASCDGFTPTGGTAAERAWMDTVEDRLEQMETQQRLFNSSIRGGAIVAYTDELQQIARLGAGTYSAPGSPDGIRRDAPVFAVSNGNRFHVLIDAEFGWYRPAFRYNFVEDTYKPVTNSDFERCWKSHFNLLGMVIVVYHLVTADASTNGEFRLGLSNSITSDVVTISGGEQKWMFWAWDVSDQLNIGGNYNLSVEAKRTSGTGNINVYSPEDFYVVSENSTAVATPGGIPST